MILAPYHPDTVDHLSAERQGADGEGLAVDPRQFLMAALCEVRACQAVLAVGLTSTEIAYRFELQRREA